ncbi:Vegetative incompatibility protein HET-E-1 [Colletotrichum tanaceti]|uniref:Vegetative incompatibility protein HET-E-1 n=1 Tax=Colletotrichum tanaceti TaxID=1306861 RepID=A0A4U6X0J5_9PEZI|nr:Vegetative incompatibility protein HET-E-1 [Colletotrichum tanaceti]TKW48249.1 Vegetative incompatibility protein HET-E-1 [Colletotrichum tanaceti]
MDNLEKVRHKAGHAKIERLCEIALRRYGCKHAWLDTCCIDKTSSAELSEAINSMFRWYKEAYVCFVFISDLAPETARGRPAPPPPPPPSDHGPAYHHDISDLSRCKWYVEFYDAGRAARLSAITNIDVDILMLKKELSAVPAADRAYSLLGLFDINVSMLYGEGHRAFQRLKEEIAPGAGRHVSWEESKLLELFPPFSFRVLLDLGKDGGRIVSAEPERLWDPVHLADSGSRPNVELHGWLPEDWLASNAIAAPETSECDLEELLGVYRESARLDKRGHHADKIRAVKRKEDLRVTVSRMVEAKMDGVLLSLYDDTLYCSDRSIFPCMSVIFLGPLCSVDEPARL